MLYKISKILLTIFVFFLPSFAFAGPSVVWSTQPAINGNVVTGFLTVSGIDPQMPPLMLVLFSDADGEFNPYVSSAILGPASNNTYNFTAPFDGTLTYFLPVLDGSFDGGTSFNPFTAYSVGQVANVTNPTGGGDPNNPTGGTPTTTPGGVVPPCVGTVAQPCVNTTPAIQFSPGATIHNPLGAEFDDMDILEFLKKLFENFVKIALPFLVLFTIWAGLQFVLARGNSEKISDAKKNFLYVIIGLAIVFGAWGLAEILSGTVDQFEAANFVMKLLV